MIRLAADAVPRTGGGGKGLGGSRGEGHVQECSAVVASPEYKQLVDALAENNLDVELLAETPNGPVLLNHAAYTELRLQKPV